MHSKKNVRKGAVERNDKYSSESSDDSASSGCEMEYSKPVNQTLVGIDVLCLMNRWKG